MGECQIIGYQSVCELIMSIYSQTPAYGVVNNPITDSPYIQQNDVGSNVPPPPVEGFFLLLSGENFGLLSGFDLTLL